MPLHAINLYVIRLVPNQIVLCFIFYTIILHTFNLYAVLASNCIYQFCIHSFYVHSICMIFFPQIEFINFVCTHITHIQFVWFSFLKLYLSILYTLILRTFNLYPFLFANSFISKGKMSSDKPRNSRGPLHHWKSNMLPWLHTRESSLRESFPHLNTMRIITFVHLYLSICIYSNLMYAFK